MLKLNIKGRSGGKEAPKETGKRKDAEASATVPRTTKKKLGIAAPKPKAAAEKTESKSPSTVPSETPEAKPKKRAFGKAKPTSGSAAKFTGKRKLKGIKSPLADMPWAKLFQERGYAMSSIPKTPPPPAGDWPGLQDWVTQGRWECEADTDLIMDIWLGRVDPMGVAVTPSEPDIGQEDGPAPSLG